MNYHSALMDFYSFLNFILIGVLEIDLQHWSVPGSRMGEGGGLSPALAISTNYTLPI